MSGERATRSIPWLFAAMAFFAPISIAVSQPLAYLILPVAAWARLREGTRGGLGRSPFLWPLLAFGAAALASAFLGVRPELSLSKIDRLLMAGVILAAPLAATAAGSASELGRRIALAFVLGAAVQATIDLVALPVEYARETSAYAVAKTAGTLAKGEQMPTFYDMGNMRDPQMYMVALGILCCGFLRLPDVRRTPGWWIVLAVLLVAFVMHFKRGAWLALLLSVIVFALFSGRRSLVIGALVLPCLLLLLPPVQARLAQAREEMKLKTGGRVALWVKVAPELIDAHPAGMGYRAVKNEDFQGHGVKIQKKLDHLHNNVLQVLLETGWAGLAVWLWWMATAFILMIRAVFANRDGPHALAVAHGVLVGFLALHLNGMVEYNFGDGEIFLVYCTLMAVAAVTYRREPGGSATIAVPLRAM